ncbi:MAG TPA: chromate transporter [Candidatus Binatia bacterium]|nr:chromate transporter [Candidatus Binatia bacterium]
MSDLAPGGEPRPAELPPAPPPGPAEIFWTFARIALSSFGGGLALWTQREVVDRKRWVTIDDFLAGLALARLLPGANQVNLAAHLGTRFAGGRGALAAVAGLTVVPFAILVALGVAYFQLHELPALQSALRGAVAVAAGMAIAMGAKLARPFARRPDAALLAAAAFAAVHVLHWRIPWVVAGLAPIAIAWFWPHARTAAREERA